MAERTWDTIELPIIEMVVVTYQRGETVANAEEVAEGLRIEVEAAERAIEMLHADGYVEGPRTLGGFVKVRPTPKAMRASGAWPRDVMEEAMRALQDGIATESDPVRRRGLEKVRDGLVEVGTGTASGVLTAILRNAVGL